jgi:hypothetical protein
MPGSCNWSCGVLVGVSCSGEFRADESGVETALCDETLSVMKSSDIFARSLLIEGEVA